MNTSTEIETAFKLLAGSLAGALEIAWPVTSGLVLLFVAASFYTAFAKPSDLRLPRWMLLTPLMMAVGMACLGGLFAHDRPAGRTPGAVAPESAVVALFLAGLALAILAVVRARGRRMFVASLLALQVWYASIVAFCALIVISGESFY